MANNPFTLMYGKTPASVVERAQTIQLLLNQFSEPNPQIQSYLVTGVRGSGKTVVLREVSARLAKQGWIVLDLNPRGDLIRSFAEQLYAEGNKRKLYLDWTLSLGGPYLSLSIKKGTPSTSPEVVARTLVEKATKDGKRILVTIDEVTPTESLRFFANFFQAMVGRNDPICLLMTGIKDNINDISADAGMSFISRSPKVELGPLDYGQVALEYTKSLNIPMELAVKMSKLTLGYAFGYQVLGYFFLNMGKTDVDDELIRTVSSYLWQNGYDVIWKGLTHAERRFLIATAELDAPLTADIMSRAELRSSNYQNYRGRLIEKGIILPNTHGRIEFALPFFRGYVLLMKAFEAD